jgi:hypothetical protein
MMPLLLVVALLSAVLLYVYLLARRVAFRGAPIRLLRGLLTDPYAALETRAAPLVVPSTADYATLVRALGTERILLLSAALLCDGVGEFKLLGETGAVYTVWIGAQAKCSCPAFFYSRNARQCKHLGYVKVKVLGVPASHYLATQSAYLRVELRELLDAPATARAHLAPLGVREAVGAVPQRAAAITTVCAVCYDELGQDAQEVCAAACRTPFHAQCLRDYFASLAGDGKATICPCCRTPWVAALVVGSVNAPLGSYVTVSHPHGKKRSPSRARK